MGQPDLTRNEAIALLLATEVWDDSVASGDSPPDLGDIKTAVIKLSAFLDRMAA